MQSYKKRDNSVDSFIFGPSGLRGIVGKTLSPEIVLKFASAFGEYCKSGANASRDKIILGRDSRKSGEMLWHTVVSGLLSCGCQIIDIGICPTPTVGIAIKMKKADGGIVITASHNPIEWNGLKFFSSNGTFLTDSQREKFIKLLEKKRDYKSYNRLGKLYFEDGWEEKHIERIVNLKYINKNKIKKKKLKVVLDCNNGAGSLYAPYLLKSLGCEVIKLFCDITKDFSHPPEPQAKNLKRLIQEVKKKKADIGFAIDPDADRLAVVSEKGIPLGEEYTLALATDFVLSKRKGDVVTNFSTSQIIDDIAKKYNAKVHRTKVGEIYVAQKLKKLKGIIGGEGNGGVILPEFHPVRDALLGMALILQHLAENNLPISELVKKIPFYFMVKKAIKLEKNFENRLERLKRRYKGIRISQIDGLKIEFKDSWVQIRKSNTEPIVRIFAEAESKRKAEGLVRNVMKSLI